MPAQERLLVIRQELGRQGREKVLDNLHMVGRRKRRDMDGKRLHQHSVPWIRMPTAVVKDMATSTGTPNLMHTDYDHRREGPRWQTAIRNNT